MRNGHADEIAKLIEPGRVHRRVYTFRIVQSASI
jgi:hypothetical protein